VKSISFDEGKPVKAGDVLLAIDDSELRAQRARAKAQLELASAAEARQRDLLQSRGISPADYDQSIANLNIAKAELALIESQLAKTEIRAPFDGVAGFRRVSVGTYLTPGTQICSFQDISSLKIDFSLPEVYLPYLRSGQRVTFQITGRPEKFEATVLAIEPTVDVATRSLLVRATVPNEDSRLLPGSFAEVEVMLGEIKDTILIPAIALIPGLKQQTVFVHHDGKVEERKVLAGLRTADSVQIVEGLQMGDELITSGILQLRPGMNVQVKRCAKAAQAREGGPRE
jgi:membrane fusion protein (multidrug efflux system)